jgi:hypothetical protein
MVIRDFVREYHADGFFRTRIIPVITANKKGGNSDDSK